jgi:aldehyde:ferredoxin oxidoreductase
MHQYIGGKGLGSKYLYDELKPHIDPLGPENKLFFVGGPLTGTLFPTSNRYGLLFKSPLTHTYAESYSGGALGQIMMATGFLVFVIEGQAAHPTYLRISNSEVSFNDATSLWGKDTFETTDLLRSQFAVPTNQAKKQEDCLVIGPAGERLIRYASIQNNKYHSAARCGPGAVMGSKKLKAIAFSGEDKPSINNNPAFRDLVRQAHQKLRAKPDLFGKDGLYRKYGTPSITDWANELGCFPTRYFTACHSNASELLNGDTLNATILKKRTGCWNCPFTCSKYVEVSEGPYQCAVEGPEYETIALFGGVCDIRDLGAIAKINEYCDRMGLDTISAGSLCGFAIEAKNRHRLPGAENLDLAYNNPDSVLKFLTMIVQREGLGKIFGEGTIPVTNKFQLHDLAMHGKGLDFAGYDARAFRGFAVSYGVSPEGPTHLRSVYHTIERHHPDRLGYVGKIAPMIENEDLMALIDSLIVCKFIRAILDWDFLVDIYRIVFDCAPDTINIPKLRQICGEIVTLSRKFNVREGFSRKDDYLSDRVFTEPLTCRNGSQIIIDREKYDKMLDEYYQLRGWRMDGTI